MAHVDDETTPLWVWCGLSAIACASFWFQAVITEEFFVPALNVIANGFNIPDDIAGATLMAAGASSPELFSSIVSLFITHSALGLGTIVGSEIFNQLVICAGAVAAAKSGRLELDPWVLGREVGFYALSIALLYIALQDTRPDAEDGGVAHIYISTSDAAMVFSGYIAYVIVCANFETIVGCFKRPASRRGGGFFGSLTGTSRSYGSMEAEYSRRMSLNIDQLPFLRESPLSKDPSSNFVQLYRTKTGEKDPELQHLDTDTQGSHTSALYSLKRAMGAFSDGNTLRQFNLLVQSSRPSDEHGLYDMEVNSFEGRLSCFMWQRSYFYTKARFATKGWHLRWFTLTPAHVISVPDRSGGQVIRYPRFTEMEFDERRLILRLINPDKSKRDFYLMAPSMEILEAFVRKMGEILEAHVDQEPSAESFRSEAAGAGHASDDHESLIAFPVDGTAWTIIIFLLLFPLRFVMYWTVPDVRVLDSAGNPVGSLGKAFAATFMCLAWLIVGSYAMVSSLEALADLLDIPTAVVGVTVSAAGTSLPNYIASKVASENGFGVSGAPVLLFALCPARLMSLQNMAVSNAFGSNTFNIMVGLGLPWLLYTSFGTHFQPYHGLRDEGITQSVLILASVLAVFIVLVVPSGFTIHPWHGIVFVVLYVAYLAFSIGQVYL